MPWCPKCGSEYRAEFDTCKDCGEVLVSDEPESSPHRRKPSRFDIVLGYFCSVVLIILTYCTAYVIPLFAREFGEATIHAIRIGILCLGGIVCALHEPKARLGLFFMLWLIPPFAFIISMLVYLLAAHSCEPRNLLDLQMIRLLGPVVIFAGIGAVTATIAGKWFCGQGWKYALALLATIVAFVSTPFVINWLVARLYG